MSDPRDEEWSVVGPRNASSGSKRDNLPYRERQQDQYSHSSDNRSGRGGGQRGARNERGGRGDRGGRGGRGGRGDRGGRGGRGGNQPDKELYNDGDDPAVPDPSITVLEDKLVVTTRDKFFNGMPGRRGYGTQGRAITLRANYLPISTTHESDQDEVVLNQYKIEITPDLDSKPKRRRFITAVMAHPKFSHFACASDYAETIITTGKIDLPGKLWSEKMILPKQLLRNPIPPTGSAPALSEEAQDRNTFTFVITYTDGLSLREMMEFLKSNTSSTMYGGSEFLIQALNIAMCNAPSVANFVAKAGRNAFFPFQGNRLVEPYNLTGALHALRGYFSSVRPAVGRLLLNLNVTSGAFYNAGPLDGLLNAFNRTMRTTDMAQQEAFIRLLKVEVTYTPGSSAGNGQTVRSIKTIQGFARPNSNKTDSWKRFGSANEVDFMYQATRDAPNNSGQRITVAQYFRKHHRIDLRYPNSPVLNCGTVNNPQYIPMEFCTVIAGQKYCKFLTSDQTAAMIKFAARPPKLNAMSIAGTVQEPGNGLRLFELAGQPDVQKTSVERFGFKVGTQLIAVPGRVHKSPQLQYGNNQEKSTAFGMWNSEGLEFHSRGNIGQWATLVINVTESPEDCEPMLVEFGHFLLNYVAHSGRQATQTITIRDLTKARRPNNDQLLKTEIGNAKSQNARFLFIILPKADRWLYARIKYWADVEFGIHTICITRSKLEKRDMSIMANLALKFNIKGGGTNHIIQNIMTDQPLTKNTMLMGIDVTHPSPGAHESAPSISAVVASVDEHLNQWPGSITSQTGRKEMVEGLTEMVGARLDLWHKNNNKRWPDQIVVYRDGVSDSQYETVLTEELPSFVEAFKKRYGAEEKYPKMTIIVVGKRHHTRFYPMNDRDADSRSGNPQPGTVVDRHISGRNLGEFWLQAHSGLTGTARPAHYVIIKDDIKFEPDQLEQFTHKMCYLFNRATKAVSICPPAYYADLLCERGRFYLYTVLGETGGDKYDRTKQWKGEIHDALKDSTFYI